MKNRTYYGPTFTFLLLAVSLILPTITGAVLGPPPDFPLLEAVKKGDIETVKVILTEGPSDFSKEEVNRRGMTGDAPLSIAAGAGNLEIVKLLVRHGATVDVGKERDDKTPLIDASARGRVEVVRFLIDNGADVNAKGKGATPLLVALAGRYSPFNNADDMEKTIHILLENGADVNVQDESWMKTGCTPLMYAVTQGDAAMVRALLSKGARLELKNKDDETALSLAKKNGLEYIAQLLEKPDRSDSEVLKKVVSAGHHLFVAIKQGRISEVKRLIVGGIDVNLRTPDGDTPLMVAANNNKVEIVRLLLNAGADVNAKNGANNTALIYASLKGHGSVVNELLRAKADVNVKNISREDALIYAVKGKETRMIESLLKAGAKTDDRYEDGRTALIIAAANGYTDGVRLLIAHKADVNAVDKEHMTALMIASEKGNINLVEMLLKSGAHTDSQSTDGDTALGKAISINNLPIVRMLIKNGRDFDRQRALFSAVIAGNLEIVKLLFNKDVDVNARGFAGGTLLMLAADGDPSLVKFLISKGADVATKDDEEETALMKAVTSPGKSNLSSIRYLIERGANVNDANKKGETALILAVKSRKPDVVRMLIQKGSSLSVKDKDGKTAWAYAFESDQKVIVDLLEKAGAKKNYSGMQWDGYVSKQKVKFIKVVDTQEEWSELWQRAFEKPAPAVDFENFVVACVFLGHNAKWLYSIAFGGPEFTGGKLVVSYALHDVMLRLSGPFRAGGQYAMKVYEKQKGAEMVLRENGSTSQMKE